MGPTLVSVNVGQLAPLTADAPKRSGIRKYPVGGAVLCDTLGLVGDAIGNLKHHGGPDQAVYLYSAEDYAWWREHEGVATSPGYFGENLTIDAWWPEARVGDRVTFGDVTLELSAPRIPCATLAARVGDPQFVKRFANAARPGAYARVITTGALEVPAAGVLTRGDASWPTVVELLNGWYRLPRNRAALLAYTKAPLAVRAREAFVTWAAGA